MLEGGPIQDDPTLENYNVELKASLFLNQIQTIANGSASTSNAMYSYGDDFAYMDADMTFKNCEKLIDICNKYNKVNITCVMSTPGRYIDALKKENVTWPVKYGDFMSYLAKYNSEEAKETERIFWSGFYSSRPAFKK